MTAKSEKRRKRIKLLIYFLVIFVFQEVVIRFCYPLPELSNFDRIHYMILNGEKNVHSRNQHWFWESSLDQSPRFNHTMNQYGFRDVEWAVEKPVKKQRAFFIGDSFIEGIMAEQDETIPESFKKASNNSIETFNFGMLGVGLDSYLQLMADAIPIYKPDIVFLCIYANDFGSRPPIVPTEYLEPREFVKLRPRFLELMKQSSTNGPVFPIWKDDYLPYIPACPNPGNPWTTDEASLKGIVSEKIEKHMKEGTFNPKRVNEFLKEVQHLNKSPQLGETIPFFKHICEQNGARPVVVYIPSRNQVTTHYYQYEKELSVFPDSVDMTIPEYQLPQRILGEQCADFGIQYIDLTPAVRKKEANGQRMYWNYDSHFTGTAYQFCGEKIFEMFRTSTLPE